MHLHPTIAELCLGILKARPESKAIRRAGLQYLELAAAARRERFRVLVVTPGNFARAADRTTGRLEESRLALMSRKCSDRCAIAVHVGCGGLLARLHERREV